MADATQELATAIKGKSDQEILEGLTGQYDMMLGSCFDGMKGAFLPAKAAGANAVVQYDIKGADAVHTYQVKVANGACEVVKGATGPARVTIAISAPDFLRLMAGQLDGMQAFFSGKMKLSGDMMFAQTAASWFKA